MKTKTVKIGSRLRKPRHLPEEVASILLDEIEKGTFQTGERLPAEMTLAKEFDVSRTVIREALARLKYDGLLDTRQGRGASVTNINMRNAFRLEAIGEISRGKFEHLMELRVIVESDTSSLAALRHEDSHIKRLKVCLELMDDAVSNKRDGSDPDLEFHKEIAKASGNPYLIEFIQFLNGRLKEIIKISREQANIIQGMSETVQKEHVAIFDAIVDRNFSGARKAMVRHITNTSRGLGLNITDLLGK
jgi:GntR family transcriptional repressor for pyruvate dehydrogenase complex